jgi:hypothetical protein
LNSRMTYYLKKNIDEGLWDCLGEALSPPEIKLN